MLKKIPLNNVILKYSDLFYAYIFITDTKGTIVFSSLNNDVGKTVNLAQYTQNLNEPSLINIIYNSQLTSTTGDKILYFTPLANQNENLGYIVVEADKNIAAEAGKAIKIACEAIIAATLENIKVDCMLETKKAMSMDAMHAYLISALLSENFDTQYVSTLFHQMELDENLLRSVICIEIAFKTSQYFNINLNLGYLPVIENARAEIIAIIKGNKYFNTQDLCEFYGENKIIILKSFIKNDDIPRTYLALDKICSEIQKDLSNLPLLEIKMSYGNLYEDILHMKNSYIEATKTLYIGQIQNPSLSFYNINNIIIDNICYFLQPQIINKIILPSLKKLTSETGEFYFELLTCCEIFVDACMNFTTAAKIAYIHRNTMNTRLQKLKLLTNLDPISSFSDALTVKLLAVFLRQNKHLYQNNELGG
jgi:sugar diacid utilization regulator